MANAESGHRESWVFDGTCTKCNATMTWEGDKPDEPEDALCDPCVREERIALRARVAELEAETKRHDTALAVERTMGRDDERTDVVAWLRGEFGQNRNARLFADAIEKGEQVAWCATMEETGNGEHR